VDSKDFCFYKSTNGIKRHLAVDTLGFPFFTHCTQANVSDDIGLLEMLTLNINYFKSKPVNIAKITILLDHGYHIDYLIEALEKIYPQIMTKIRFELSTKPSKQEKAAQGKAGFAQPWQGGSLNARMLGWIVVKVWSRTLSEPYLMPRPKSISALSGLCSRDSQPLPEISNRYYRSALIVHRRIDLLHHEALSPLPHLWFR
jgi:hypothetical protein